MRSRATRVLCALGVIPTVFLGLALVGPAAPASASASAASNSDPTIPINWYVNAKTHLAKPDLDVTVPEGTFVGSIDLATGALTGDLSLPPAQTTISVIGQPAVTATFSVTEVGPITGQVNLQTFQVTTSATFEIHITRVTSLGLPVNLVGSNCQTSTPVTVDFSGVASLTSASTFSSTYTIPPLANCGLTTPVLNLAVPGPGNTFTATFSPTP
jgi:hypothetical protein